MTVLSYIRILHLLNIMRSFSLESAVKKDYGCHRCQPPTDLLTIATSAPSADSMLVMPRPTPVPPPVMNATFPANAFAGSIGVIFAGKKRARFDWLLWPAFVAMAAEHVTVTPPWCRVIATCNTQWQCSIVTVL